MNPQKKPTQPSFSIGDILKKVVKKEGLGKKALEGKRLGNKVVLETLGAELASGVQVAQIRTGVAIIECDSSVMFQELEGFRRQELIDALQKAGLKVKELRVRLKAN